MQPIKGGRVTTTQDNQELIAEGDYLKKVSIHNQSEKEVNISINGGNRIPLSEGESLSLGELKIVSLVVIEKGSTIRFIGI